MTKVAQAIALALVGCIGGAIAASALHQSGWGVLIVGASFLLLGLL